MFCSDVAYMEIHITLVLYGMQDDRDGIIIISE